MGKRAAKRQKTGADAPILGAKAVNTALLEDDSTKDDEELRLESMLFGKPYVPSGKGKQRELLLDISDEEDGDGNALQDVAGRELENMLDTDLFFIDDSAPSGAHAAPEPSDHESETDGDSDADDQASTSEASASSPPSQPLTSARKKPAWTDPDDPSLQVSLTAPRLRKLRDAPGEDTVGGREYERRLRRQYERINPAPAWAAKTRKSATGVKRVHGADSDITSDEEAGDQGGMDDLLNTTAGLLGERKRGVLAKGTLAIERLRDANIGARAEGSVNCIRFHPSPTVPVLCVASADRRLRLFNIDGHTNPLLHTLHIPELPVRTALFHPRGDSLLLAGPRPFFHTYSLATGATSRSPRGLWGSASNNTQNSLSLETTAFSADGSLLAVAGRGGHIHLVDYAAGASGAQVIGGVKMNRPAKALWWAPDGTMMSLADDSEVYVWDVGERRCVRKWKDDGAYGARMMEGDSQGRYMAIGSTTGYVNVYGPDAATGVTGTIARPPRPLKAIANLTTSITTLRFNSDAQMLAIGSDAKKDQLRLIHLPSLTAFSNWPTAGTPLGRVSSVDFSAGSEYVAVGNTRGRVLLYGLKGYGT